MSEKIEPAGTTERDWTIERVLIGAEPSKSPPGGGPTRRTASTATATDGMDTLLARA